ncbi:MULTISPECIES: RNA-guided endonuclease InsQ/TnpB family protein [unclassified Streptomyces]|uniref:RNA-guided endonuclease InsQ/TnpB family protein n=1 Tax=unclassified Streptomyces TaxID=2593676 RepID=UPI001904C635|nr:MULTISPECIES: RNA-guided endonuclease TnpB family protein [unclassified Streptomyces]MCU4746071.1 transposase [Streptomyces sp. G-5]QQN76400.1 transposase [Streptomyces sp. XC 2026]
MIRAHKFLLRPTVRQRQALGEMLRDHCSLCNGALQERRDAYRHASKTSITYGHQSAQLKEIRAFDPERQGRWSFSSQQATLRRLDKAFQAFFRRVKAGEKPGYPRFRGVNWFDTVEFPKDGDGCRWDSTPHDPVTRVRLRGVGHVRVHQHRPVKGRVKTVSVGREGKHWYVILACDNVAAEPLPATGAVTGIDMGVTHFLTTSQGAHVENPRNGKRNADALAEAQRALKAFPRRKREDRSAKHRRAVEKVAGLHRKVRRQRLDHAHKAALALVRDYDQIAHERLNIAGMVRTPLPKPAPETPGAFLPNGAASKAGLNRSILDAGWGVFLGILAQKAESAARVLIPVDPRNTSRTCPKCGHVDGENRDGEKFQCTACGHRDHADRVGAWNVALRAGLVLPDVA